MLDWTYGEDPLERCWHSPTPLVVALVVGVGDSGDDDAPDGPAHLQCCCACTPQRQRNDLTGVGRAVCDEEAPWDTFECLSDNENLQRIGLDLLAKFFHIEDRKAYEEGDEDRCIHQEQSKQCRPSVAQSVRNGAGEKHSNECTTLAGLEER
jgi:hypothetical protein